MCHVGHLKIDWADASSHKSWIEQIINQFGVSEISIKFNLWKDPRTRRLSAFQNQFNKPRCSQSFANVLSMQISHNFAQLTSILQTSMPLVRPAFAKAECMTLLLGPVDEVPHSTLDIKAIRLKKLKFQNIRKHCEAEFNSTDALPESD